MKYLILMDGKPMWSRNRDQLFFALPFVPAQLYGTYEEARSVIRRAERWELGCGFSTPRSYRIQSVTGV